VPAAGAALLAAATIAAFSGCGGRSSAATEGREIRLTTDGAPKYYPRYSHDNTRIAYAAHADGGRDVYATYVIPRTGGQPTKVSPDSLSLYPLEWSPDDRGLLCLEAEGRNLYYLGLDGSVRRLREGDPLTRVLAITPDGQTALVSRFNRDNRDIAFQKADRKLEYLAETTSWEEDAVFGPRPGDVTVVAAPSYLAPINTIAIWSSTTRTYSPLPLPEGRKRQPAWAPDGGMLAYVVATGGQSDLWLYDPATTRARPLVEDPQEEGQPAWSRDGEGLAFVRGTTTSHLYAGAAGDAGRRQLTDGPATDYSPVASPDGKSVAFLRRPRGGPGTPGSPSLCVVPSAGGEVKELDLKGVTLPSMGSEMIAWSPDSRHLAFSGSDGSAKMDVYRIGRDGEGLARVTVEPGEEVEPRWSPDGRFILFTQTGGHGLDVAIVPAHGGLTRSITPKGEKCEGGVWSPGSDRVAYVSYREDGHFEIWSTSIAEPGRRARLLESKGFVWPMFWTDDGRTLVLLRGSGKSWVVQTLALDGGAVTEIGRGTRTASGKDMLYRFAAGAEKYEKLFYPAGVVVMDGKDSFDLYVIRARERLSTVAASHPSPWTPRYGQFLLDGCL